MLSVVIPAHNEAGNLPSLIAEVRMVLQGQIEFEVIVVDDGSSDNTRDVLMKIRKEVEQLRVIRHQICCGQSYSLLTGIDAARGEIIATLDGDGQNDPADLLTMLQTLQRECLSGVRMIAGMRIKRRDPAWRLFCSRIANGVRSRLLGDSVPDSGCGIKLFYRDSFRRLPRFHHMHRFLPALIQRDGGLVVSLAVNHRPRSAGRSHYGTMGRLVAGIVDLAGVSWLRRRSRVPIVEGSSEENGC